MLSLAVGLIAAVAWGIHDICVRQVSQRTPILPALFTVLLAGSVIVAPIALWRGEPIAAGAGGLAVFGGALFGLASAALYRAFRIGPVRVVAPIIGAYPVLSVGWAAISGNPVSLWEWVAVFAIVIGVGIVAGGGDDDEDGSRQGAILWSVLASVGFAVAFATLQSASKAGGELTVIALSRVAALAVIGGMAASVNRSLLAGVAVLPVLFLMGALDALAHGAVTWAGSLPRPEFAVVASSMFGLLTILLARVFLSEEMSLRQWGGVVLAFAAIGFLAS